MTAFTTDQDIDLGIKALGVISHTLYCEPLESHFNCIHYIVKDTSISDTYAV